MMLRQVMQFYAVMALISAGLLVATENGQTLLRSPGWSASLYNIGVGVGAGLVLLLASNLLTAWTQWAARLRAEFVELVRPFQPRDALWLALGSAVGEEMLFRGVLQPAIGLWPATALFALLHIGPTRRMVAWPFLAFVGGALFGTLQLITDGLLAPITAHFLLNWWNLNDLLRRG